MKTIKLQEPSFGKLEVKHALEVLESTQVVMGKKTIEFQKKWGEWLNMPYNTMVNSGSSANLLIMHLLTSKRGNYKLNPGDEIIIPAVTWSTTLFPILQLGLKPVLADVNPKTFNIDVASCQKVLTKKTKAVFIVHLLGNPCNMDEILKFCNENNLILIEDCCEAHGSGWENKKTGTFGIASSFSFMFAHHISTIEGGVVSVKNLHDDSVVKAGRAHGWIREMDTDIKSTIFEESGFDDDRFLFWDTGYNVRPTEISAVFGVDQLEKIDSFIQTREHNFNRYINKLKELQNHIQVQELENPTKSHRSNFAFGFYLKEQNKYSRKALVKHLHENRIESRPLVAGNLARHPFYPLYCEKPNTELSNADKIHFGGMYLPNHQNLTESDIDYVCEKLTAYFK